MITHTVSHVMARTLASMTLHDCPWGLSAAAAAHLRHEPLDDKLAENEALEQPSERKLELHEHRDYEEAEDGAGGPQGDHACCGVVFVWG